MDKILLKAASFMIIITFGYIMSSRKILDPCAGNVINKIFMYITLPAVIITNFAGITSSDTEMLLVVVLGIIANIVMIAIAVLLTRHKSVSEKAYYILSLSGYSIGAFCLPFVQSFLPATGSMAACMFDVGNSIMCTGGTYAFAAGYLSETKEKYSLSLFVKRLLSSIPLIVYVTMFLTIILNISIPKNVLSFIEPAANANTFLAMLMIGLLMRFEINKKYIKSIVIIILIRTISAIAFSLISFYILPFNYIIRKTLVLICFSPISVIAPTYTGACGGDKGLASCVNSVSIVCSLISLSLIAGIL